jgi:hypothetical protein
MRIFGVEKTEQGARDFEEQWGLAAYRHRADSNPGRIADAPLWLCIASLRGQ